MDSSSALLINRFFTRNTFEEIIQDDESPTYSATIRKYVINSERMTNQECISEVYRFLKKEYRNEYYYKNSLLNKLLLGVHSPRTTTALTEVPIAKSKADFILVNGKAIVYEIKTDLDNFDRLDRQINDYYKAFSRVTVVTSEKNENEVKERLQHSPVGVYVLTSRGQLSLKKEAEENKESLSKTVMFNVLRKNEYEKVLIESYGVLPNVSQFEYYRKCQELFEALPDEEAYSKFLEVIKLRGNVDVLEYSRIPYELKYLVYFSKYKKSEYEKLWNFLKK